MGRRRVLSPSSSPYQLTVTTRIMLDTLAELEFWDSGIPCEIRAFHGPSSVPLRGTPRRSPVVYWPIPEALYFQE